MSNGELYCYINLAETNYTDHIDYKILDNPDPEPFLKIYDEYARYKKLDSVWPIYEDFDIFVSDLKGKVIQKLTDAPGYDAEATLSAQGDKIVFTSTRSGDFCQPGSLQIIGLQRRRTDWARTACIDTPLSSRWQPLSQRRLLYLCSFQRWQRIS